MTTFDLREVGLIDGRVVRQGNELIVYGHGRSVWSGPVEDAADCLMGLRYDRSLSPEFRIAAANAVMDIAKEHRGLPADAEFESPFIGVGFALLLSAGMAAVVYFASVVLNAMRNW